MKISLLLKREPFDKIFEITVTRFLSSINKNKSAVIWSNSQKIAGHQVWICNKMINSIFIRNVNNKVFDTIKGEYSKNPLFPWKSLIQKLYLWAATSSYTSGILAHNYVNIKPSIKSAEDLLFLGGNTKIRLLDTKNKLVYVMLKEGYEKKYFLNELYIRKKHQLINAPKIFIINKNEYWYSEEYILGVSPDRLDLAKSRELTKLAIAVMHDLYVKTIAETNSDKYLNDLITSIHLRVKNIEKSKKQNFNSLLDSTEVLRNKLSLNLPKCISTCQNHGDLQFGNILWDTTNEKLWIMDWEFTKVRQYGYDLFVLCMSVRSTQEKKRINNVIDNGFNEKYSYYFQLFPHLDIANIYSLFTLFLLEELDFRLEEMEVAAYKNQYKGIGEFSNYLTKLAKSL